MRLSDINILIVDDDPIVSETFIDFFTDNGFNVIHYSDAEGALNGLVKANIAVSIVDLRLPGMDGNSFIKKACEISPKTKFIIYTGSTSYQLTDDMRSCGIEMENVFYKPISDLNIFIKAIENLLNKSYDK